MFRTASVASANVHFFSHVFIFAFPKSWPAASGTGIYIPVPDLVFAILRSPNHDQLSRPGQCVLITCMVSFFCTDFNFELWLCNNSVFVLQLLNLNWSMIYIADEFWIELRDASATSEYMCTYIYICIYIYIYILFLRQWMRRDVSPQLERKSRPCAGWSPHCNVTAR